MSQTATETARTARTTTTTTTTTATMDPDLNDRIAGLKQELQQVKEERFHSNATFEKLTGDKQAYLDYVNSRVHATVKNVAAARMDEHYDNPRSRPPTAVLNKQSILLSMKLRRRAKRKYIKRALPQNKALAGYMLAEKFVIEDEKLALQEEYAALMGNTTKLVGLIKEKYARTLQVQRMVRQSLLYKLEKEDICKAADSTPPSRYTRQNSWRRFSISRGSSDDSISIGAFSDSDDDLSLLMEQELLSETVNHHSVPTPTTNTVTSRRLSLSMLSDSWHGATATSSKTRRSRRSSTTEISSSSLSSEESSFTRNAVQSSRRASLLTDICLEAVPETSFTFEPICIEFQEDMMKMSEEFQKDMMITMPSSSPQRNVRTTIAIAATTA